MRTAICRILVQEQGPERVEAEEQQIDSGAHGYQSGKEVKYAHYQARRSTSAVNQATQHQIKQRASEATDTHQEHRWRRREVKD